MDPLREDPDRKSPFDVALEDGDYGLMLVARDKAGNMSPLPGLATAPQLRLLVDRQPPRVMLLSHQGEEVIAGGGVSKIQYRVVDPNLTERPVSISVSTDGGATWDEVMTGLANTGLYEWTVPLVTEGRVKVKVTAADKAGRTASASSSGVFAIDSAPPEIRVGGPARSRTPAVEIAYDARDVGAAGLARVELWVTEDLGATWKLAATDTDCASPVPFEGEAGRRYGIQLVAFDRLGNHSAVPDAKTYPPAQIAIEEGGGPNVRLVTFREGRPCRGGTTAVIQWETAAGPNRRTSRSPSIFPATTARPGRSCPVIFRRRGAASGKSRASTRQNASFGSPKSGRTGGRERTSPRIPS